MILTDLLENPAITTKIVSERLCIGLRTVQNYANGTQKIPDPIVKLIRYEFSAYLPKGEGLVTETAKEPDFQYKKEAPNGTDAENQRLQQRVAELENDKKMLTNYIKSLEHQLGINGDDKQTA